MPNKMTSVRKTINLMKPTSPKEEAEYLVLNNSNRKYHIVHFNPIYKKYKSSFFFLEILLKISIQIKIRVERVQKIYLK